MARTSHLTSFPVLCFTCHFWWLCKLPQGSPDPETVVNIIFDINFFNFKKDALVPGVVMISLQIGSWAWQKFWKYSEKVTQERKKFWKSIDIHGSYLPTTTGQATHLGCMAGAGWFVTSTDIDGFSKFFVPCIELVI